MDEATPNIYALDAAYKPFPTFEEWTAGTRIETVRWDRYKASLESNSSLSEEQLQHARQIAKRAAALDTGAIEGLYDVDRGFTYTVAFETAAWEAALAAKGEHVKPLFEAQLGAYDYVLDFATKAEPISEAAIRTLHGIVCGAQDTYRVITSIGPQEQPLPKGEYKLLPNHVRTRHQTNHSYAPVDVTPSEMQRLVDELRSPAFIQAHPVLQAAYAHYGLVVIHPFSDGNGRVARALASVFAYRAVSTPIVILSEHKGAYLDSLEKADAGEYQSFVDFILERLLDTIKLVDESIKSALAPRPTDCLERINSLYLTKGGYTDEQVDEIGERLLTLVEQEFRRVNSAYNTSKTKSSIGIGGGNMQLTNQVATQLRVRMREPGNFPARHRGPIKASKFLQVQISTEAPAAATVTCQLSILVPRNASGEDDVILWLSNGTDFFSARLDEINAGTPGVLQIRAALFAERVCAAMIHDLVEKATKVIQALR